MYFSEWLVPPKNIKSISEGETAVDGLKQKVKTLEMEVSNEKRQRLAAEKQVCVTCILSLFFIFRLK
jgi:hypothetical protein